MEAPPVATTSGSETAIGELMQQGLVEAQVTQQQPEVTAIAPEIENIKKRKETDTRSKAWEHFEKILVDKGKLLKAKCIYCAKLLLTDAKKMAHHLLDIICSHA